MEGHATGSDKQIHLRCTYRRLRSHGKLAAGELYRQANMSSAKATLQLAVAVPAVGRGGGDCKAQYKAKEKEGHAAGDGHDGGNQKDIHP